MCRRGCWGSWEGSDTWPLGCSSREPPHLGSHSRVHPAWLVLTVPSPSAPPPASSVTCVPAPCRWRGQSHVRGQWRTNCDLCVLRETPLVTEGMGAGRVAGAACGRGACRTEPRNFLHFRSVFQITPLLNLLPTHQSTVPFYLLPLIPPVLILWRSVLTFIKTNGKPGTF